MPLPSINPARLSDRIASLAAIGARPDGGVCRVALTDEDRAGRDWLVERLHALNLTVHIDQAGNIIGLRAGSAGGDPVVMGSHIDSTPTGGRYDGTVGVLGALEVLETLNEHGVETARPLAVVAFTNEEGVRYHADLLGSRTFCGFLSVEEAYLETGVDGSRVGDELRRIGYAGSFPCGVIRPHAYLELHIEQGPQLDHERIPIGVVEAITGIAWHEITIHGQANHAGSTPMNMRHDAGLAAARIIAYLPELAAGLGEHQRATCGTLRFSPNAINVIPAEAVLSVDLRNPDDGLLAAAEQRLGAYMQACAAQQAVTITSQQLTRIPAEACAPQVVNAVRAAAQEAGYAHRAMVSGAVHDALVMARLCPTGMIFVPSRGGVSHNPSEYTAPEDIAAGANVLLRTALKLAA